MDTQVSACIYMGLWLTTEYNLQGKIKSNKKPGIKKTLRSKIKLQVSVSGWVKRVSVHVSQNNVLKRNTLLRSEKSKTKLENVKNKNYEVQILQTLK